jgi:16S rRNA processing protein RimM
MVMEDLVLIGRVARPHGIKGHLVVNPDTDFAAERFKPGEVVLVGPEATPRVIQASRFHLGRPVIALEGIETMTDAEALAGAELKVPAGAADSLPPGTFYHYDLIGCEVRDLSGRPIGPVMKVEGTMERSRLVVEGERGEILIPLVADICVEVDVAGRRVIVNPPEGLLEVNERAPRPDGDPPGS